MKHAKKLVSLLLTLVMVLSMSITVFAADPTQTPADPTETPAAEENVHTYQIYQIFTGNYADGVLSNVKWGLNGEGEQNTVVDKTVLDDLTAVNVEGKTDAEKLAVIEKYAKLDAADGTALTPFKEDTATEYTDLPNGYYLVRDKNGTQDGKGKFYTLYIVEVVDHTLKITPKGDVPKTEKKIVEGEGDKATKVDANEASIGDEVKYEITGTLPTNIADYKEYYYVFNDTLSKGLTYKENSIKVMIGNQDVTKYFYKEVSAYDATKGTTITVGIQDLLALKNLKDANEAPLVTIDKDTEIVVTYSATLNEHAVIADKGNTNDVVLDYSNDPNKSGEGTTEPPSDNPKKPEPTHPHGQTPKDEVVTYTTELTILKTDEAGNFLPGAEFTLTGSGVKVALVTKEEFVKIEDVQPDTEGLEDTEYWLLKNGKYTTEEPVIASDETDNSKDYESTTQKYKKIVSIVQKGAGQTETNVVGTVDPSTGKVTFTGLGAGDYTITESKTPAGYNTMEPIEFTLSFDNSKAPKFASDNTDIVVGADNKLDTTIENKKGANLPETGGIGTTIFYVVGAILMIGAGVMLVTRKRISR